MVCKRFYLFFTYLINFLLMVYITNFAANFMVFQSCLPCIYNCVDSFETLYNGSDYWCWHLSFSFDPWFPPVISLFLLGFNCCQCWPNMFCPCVSEDTPFFDLEATNWPFFWAPSPESSARACIHYFSASLLGA